MVCLYHAVAAYASQILNCFLDAVVNDPIVGRNANFLLGEECGLHGGAHAGANLERAAHLSAIAYHARHVAHHVFDRGAYLLVPAPE